MPSENLSPTVIERELATCAIPDRRLARALARRAICSQFFLSCARITEARANAPFASERWLWFI